ncbi:MAG: AzlD domain-containing protein [Treponema sp.]|nr:AzlD domain-containing protein [Treponema sp.]
MAVALAASLLSGAVIFCERLFPFALFSRRNPPPVVQFIARYIPSMVIAILVVYSLKDLDLQLWPFGIPSFAGIAATLLLNLIFKNYMLTIFGSTALFMVLSRLL